MTFTVMTLQNIFNPAGLVINLIGAFIMYVNAPKVNSKTVLYIRVEMEQILKEDKRKNRMSRNGMLLLFVGFLFQFVAFFLK